MIMSTISRKLLREVAAKTKIRKKGAAKKIMSTILAMHLQAAAKKQVKLRSCDARHAPSSFAKWIRKQGAAKKILSTIRTNRLQVLRRHERVDPDRSVTGTNSPKLISFKVAKT